MITESCPSFPKSETIAMNFVPRKISQHAEELYSNYRYTVSSDPDPSPFRNCSINHNNI